MGNRGGKTKNEEIEMDYEELNINSNIEPEYARIESRTNIQQTTETNDKTQRTLCGLSKAVQWMVVVVSIVLVVALLSLILYFVFPRSNDFTTKTEVSTLSSAPVNLNKVLTTLARSPKPAKACPPNWRQFRASCYWDFDSKRIPYNFDSAELTCKLKGGYLVEINDQDENDFVAGLVFIGDTEAWLYVGARDRSSEGNFVWQHSNSSLLFTNWYPGEPNGKNHGEYCVEMRYDGKWNDVSCSMINHFMCEMDRA